MIQVYIIDDHQLIIDAIQQHLEPIADINVMGSNTSPSLGVQEVEVSQPDVLLLDISMPEMNGLVCMNTIFSKNPQQRIIILSTHQEISIIKKALKVGARGYISKSTGIHVIDQAIRQVHSGEKYVGNAITELILADFKAERKPATTSYIIPTLTNREKEVLKLIAEEATTEEISQMLCISKNTVETHRKNLISKFQVRNSVGLVKSAIEFGILS